MAARTLRIGLIPGDGIGREVIPAGRRLLEGLPSSLNLNFSFVDLDAGFECFQRTGTAFPERTEQVLKQECDGALFGAVSSPSTPTPGYSSPIVALRKKLSLYANVRPVSTISSASSPIDLVIVRENTEDVYVKEERSFPDPSNAGETIAEATKRISSLASRRIAKMAGDIALRRQRVRDQGLGLVGNEMGQLHKRAKVTITHKSNVLPATDGLFRSTCRDVLAQPAYKDVHVEEQIVDSMVYKMFRQPGDYDVIVAPNLYGDILSDGAAALVGSLGVVPSANVGSITRDGKEVGFAIGEPCHGSAPDIAGQGISNPIATMRSCGVMLEFLGEEKAAAAVYRACDESLVEGQYLTPDLGGKGTTEQAMEDVLKRL